MEKRLSFPISEEEHQALKVLAAKEKQSMKELVLKALDKAFPNWREENKK